MTAKELLKETPKHALIKSIKTLETENFLKNAFLLEIREDLDNCYDADIKLIDSKVSDLLNTISSVIDGITQNTMELSNLSCHTKLVCELVEDTKA